MFVECRIKTFPYTMDFQILNNLATSGFIYGGILDLIICVYCGTSLYILKNPLRGIHKAHKKKAPNCCTHDPEKSKRNNIMGVTTHQAYLSLFLSASAMEEDKKFYTPKIPAYTNIENRIKSFNRCNVPYLKSQKIDLAENGFIYVVSDIIMCYYCGGCLYNLNKYHDIIVYLHRYFYMGCQHTKMTMSETIMKKADYDSIENIQNVFKTPDLEAMHYVAGEFFSRFPYFDMIYVFPPIISVDKEIENFLAKDHCIEPSITTYNYDNESKLDNKCIVCYENSANILLQPCHHVPCCSTCLINSNKTTCVYCKTQITEIVKIKYCM